MATAAGATAHSMKLVVDTTERRVLFAEASRELVEFLHSLLVSPHVSLPFDAATRNGCTPNVYASVEQLHAYAAGASIFGPPLSAGQQHQAERFFVCGEKNGVSCGDYVADQSGARCPSCGGQMAAELPRGSPGAGCSDPSGGAAMMCMLMDDLTVSPACGGGVLTMATNFMMSFLAPGAFQETKVRVGYTEAMEILETSVQSSTVLTDVFLRKATRRFGKSPKYE